MESKKESSQIKNKPHIFLPAYYTSIDYLPMLAWQKIHDKGDFTYLLHKPIKLSNKQIERLKEIWKTIYDEYIEIFGFGDNFISIIEKRTQIAKLKGKKITSGDDSIDNLIIRKQRELNSLKNYNSGAGDIYKAKIAIEKTMKIPLSMATLTVREFYSYLRDLKR